MGQYTFFRVVIEITAYVLNCSVFIRKILCLGHSFLQPDIAVFQQNVQALEQLNTRWKLYSRPVFAETLLAEFLTVFLQVMQMVVVTICYFNT